MSFPPAHLLIILCRWRLLFTITLFRCAKHSIRFPALERWSEASDGVEKLAKANRKISHIVEESAATTRRRLDKRGKQSAGNAVQEMHINELLRVIGRDGIIAKGNKSDISILLRRLKSKVLAMFHFVSTLDDFQRELYFPRLHKILPAIRASIMG